jgi:hypothetical protein
MTRAGHRVAQVTDGKGDANVQKITPFLWFDGQAEEAMKHYVSIFKDSKVRTFALTDG